MHFFMNVKHPSLDPRNNNDDSIPLAGRKLGYTFNNQNFHNVSLGQGQEVVAEAALDLAAKKGHWVILQVCSSTLWLSRPILASSHAHWASPSTLSFSPPVLSHSCLLHFFIFSLASSPHSYVLFPRPHPGTILLPSPALPLSLV